MNIDNGESRNDRGNKGRYIDEYDMFREWFFKKDNGIQITALFVTTIGIGILIWQNFLLRESVQESRAQTETLVNAQDANRARLVLIGFRLDSIRVVTHEYYRKGDIMSTLGGTDKVFENDTVTDDPPRVFRGVRITLQNQGSFPATGITASACISKNGVWYKDSVVFGRDGGWGECKEDVIALDYLKPGDTASKMIPFLVFGTESLKHINRFLNH